MLHYNQTLHSFSITTRHFTHAPLQPDTSLLLHYNRALNVILHYNQTLHSCSITTRHFTNDPLQPDT